MPIVESQPRGLASCAEDDRASPGSAGTRGIGVEISMQVGAPALAGRAREAVVVTEPASVSDRS